MVAPGRKAGGLRSSALTRPDFRSIGLTGSGSRLSQHTVGAIELERADKPNSVLPSGFPDRSHDHSSGPEVSLGLQQPTRRRPAEAGWDGHPSTSLFGLAPHGVYRAPSVAVGAVRSYRTVSPLPSGPERNRKAVCFLWHFPSRRRDRALPGMPPVAEFGLSSPRDSGRSRGPLEPRRLYQHCV